MTAARPLLFSVGALLALSCASQKATPVAPVAVASAPPALLVRLARTQCHGVCPIYVVEIDTSGGVVYQGHEFVFTLGKASAQLGAEALAALRRSIAAANLPALGEHCCDCLDVIDDASALVTFVDAGGPRTIRDDHGCRSTPPTVRALERAIDEAVGIEKWIGSDDARSACFRDHQGCPASR